MDAPAISAASLRQSLASARPPLVIDVRGADTGLLDLAPQCAGLAAVSLGLSRLYADDHEMLGHGMVVYDALYRWCKEGKQESHTWKPEAYK